ncbi:hypothetical protein PVK06_033203 [Gossypium arboreum]|uniref:Ataxin 2 SM domain-containing protein n=1 Tax=Gossypium arboreum TaxID=29729 RepID=A0ABR0NBA7_GOSAR|nr:hypothetical protein PVK06_033203 [Gossypium arboreum]
MNEALLLATVYILGLPVDVHLTDGSVYAGIFHTAAVEKEFDKGMIGTPVLKRVSLMTVSVWRLDVIGSVASDSLDKVEAV